MAPRAQYVPLSPLSCGSRGSCGSGNPVSPLFAAGSTGSNPTLSANIVFISIVYWPWCSNQIHPRRTSFKPLAGLVFSTSVAACLPDFIQWPREWLPIVPRRGSREGTAVESRMDPTLPTPQEQLRRVVDEQPADSSYDEIVREVAFAAMVERGLIDAREGRVSTHDEMRQAIDSWRK